MAEQRMSEPEKVRRRARRLATELAADGWGREEVEMQLGRWQFHPAVAFAAAVEAFHGTGAYLRSAQESRAPG
jgi:hypothetical protein